MKERHLAILVQAVKELKTLNEEIIYTGGSIVSTLLTEHHHIDLRATEDVDCIVEVYSRIEYEKIAKKFRKLKFFEDSSSSVICRFKGKNLTIDVMPVAEEVFNFSNKWYEAGVKNKAQYSIGDDIFYTLDAPYFLATKFEAFSDRGKGDYRQSHDFEDITTIFDGRPEIVNEIKTAESNLKAYLQASIQKATDHAFIKDSLTAHISDRQNLQQRADVCLERMLKSLIN